jgi:GT2 family glycosyltransferase
MSPDVMPDQPGWLGRLNDFYDSQPNIGALGPRLLFEDGSLQHAGVGFEQISPGELGLPAVDSTIWQARERFKGLPRTFAEAGVAAQVPAVSGACMLIDRAVFEDAGGLRNVYVEGEYEDADLCLRIAAAGRENWYTPVASLYHLQGRTRVPPEGVARYYNALVLTHLWGEQLESAS